MVLHPLHCIAGKGGFPSHGTLVVQCFFPIKKGPSVFFGKLSHYIAYIDIAYEYVTTHLRRIDPIIS